MRAKRGQQLFPFWSLLLKLIAPRLLFKDKSWDLCSESAEQIPKGSYCSSKKQRVQFIATCLFQLKLTLQLLPNHFPPISSDRKAKTHIKVLPCTRIGRLAKPGLGLLLSYCKEREGFPLSQDKAVEVPMDLLRSTSPLEAVQI